MYPYVSRKGDISGIDKSDGFTNKIPCQGSCLSSCNLNETSLADEGGCMFEAVKWQNDQISSNVT